MVTAGEILFASGLTVAAGVVGGFVGDSYVRANIPTAADVGDAKRAASEAELAYENLTDPNSCERGVLVSVSTNQRAVTQALGAEALESILATSCDTSDRPEHRALADQAARGLEDMANTNRHYSFLESRSENSTKDRVLGIGMGAAGMIILGGGLLIYALDESMHI